MISAFLQYLQYEKNFSSHTVFAYKKDLEQFSSFVSGKYNTQSLTDVKSDYVRDWIISLKEAKLTSTSINRKISALRSFYKFCRKHNSNIGDPLAKVSAQKTGKKLPYFFKDSEIESVLSDNPIVDSFSNSRDDIILETLYDTGIRRAELITIKDEDFNFFSLTLRVMGKGNKERLIPISNILKIKAEKYINLKKSLFGNTDSFIVTDKGCSTYPNFIYRVVKDKMSTVSMLDKRSPHVIRHTFASGMLNNGAELNAVKDLLGHANLSATQIYTHTSFEQLRSIYKQAHPRNNKNNH